MDEDDFSLSSIQVSSASTLSSFNLITRGSSSSGILISKFEGNPLSQRAPARDKRDAGTFWQLLFTLHHGNGPIAKQREDILSGDRPSRSSLGRLDVIIPQTEDRTGLERFHKASKGWIHVSVVMNFTCLECKHAKAIPRTIYLCSTSRWMRPWAALLWFPYWSQPLVPAPFS